MRAIATGALAFLLCSAAANAEERCLIASSDMIGVRAEGGKCVGVRKDLASRFLKMTRSDCIPQPRPGVSMFGHCVSDDPEQLREEAYALADRRLAMTVDELQGKIAGLKDELDRQLLELSGRMSELRGRFGETRPHAPPSDPDD